MYRIKGILFTIIILFAGASVASAGILQSIGAGLKTAAASGSLWAGLVALILVYILKAIPNQKIYDFVFAFFQRLGTVCTLGLTKWKWSAPFWQKTVEPWFIDFVQNTVGAALNGFIAGLRTDNTDG